MNIAVCGNRDQQLMRLLDRYRSPNSGRAVSRFFPNRTLLTAAVQDGAVFDAVVLALDAPAEDSLQTAAALRTFDPNLKVIVVADSARYALDAFRARAHQYLLRPVAEEPLFRTLDEICAEELPRPEERLVAKCKNGIYRILLHQLEFCEVFGHTVCYHLHNGSVLEAFGNMKELGERLLSHPQFIQPHRSYIINMDYIVAITPSEIELECMSKIPLPRAKCSEIREQYLSYSFQSLAETRKEVCL